MTSRIRIAASASSLVLAFASAAHAAQPAEAVPTAGPEAAAPEAPVAELGEIVVTARRKSESLQQVPQSVTAVTAETLGKLNIQRLEDVTAVTPGFSLTSGTSGYSVAASTRGVSFQSETAASPTVAFYLNDAPVESSVLFQSLYDVGQVEVLRGPQGTTRGISSPSGALTVTTRKPVLGEYGGYINATVTDHQGRNVNGAVNVPIIQDVLGVRIAGIIDQTDYDGVRSLNNSLRPSSKTSALRASIAFEPNDSINALVTYQHMDRSLHSYAQVAGPGAGFNGPAIASKDRLSVNDGISEVHQNFDTVTAQIDSRIFGQHLSYVGSYGFQKIKAAENVDRGNLIPGVELYNLAYSPQERTSHEIRLASEPAPGRFLDYTVGAFYNWISTDSTANQPNLLPGYFGATPTAPVDPRFQGNLSIVSPSRYEETSFFGSVTGHFGEDTELTVGGRQIIARYTRRTDLNLLLGDRLLANIPAAGKHSLDRPFIYNISLSHRFNRDFMVYANHGTSWRYGPAVIGITNAGQDPTLTALENPGNETSRSYEVGFKSTLLDGRARLNVALFRQTFKNLIIRTEPISYLANNGVTVSPSLFNFTLGVPATIEGFDIDTAFQITPEWNATLAVSYADGRIDNGFVPCNAPIPTGQAVAVCQSNGSTSRDPLWNLTITSEYARPVANNIDGFVRGLFNYYPENNRRSTALVIDDYSLLNVYAGVRSQDGAWEVSLFAKNAFKTDEVTSLDANAYTVSGNPFGSSGYFGTTYTPRREVGVNVRYAFGSR
jgi:iron complex outermembrane receptor protein